MVGNVVEVGPHLSADAGKVSAHELAHQLGHSAKGALKARKLASQAEDASNVLSPKEVVERPPLHRKYVILDHFDTVAGGLVPAGAARTEALTRHAMAGGMLDKAVRILDEQFRVQNADTAQHVAGYVRAIRAGIGWMEPRLDVARFDLGDIAFATLLAYLDMRFPQVLWRDGADRAAAWFEQVSQRPSMVATKFAEPPFV